MRYLLFSVLAVLAIGLFAAPQAFADHDEITIENAAGSASNQDCVPDCFIPSTVTIKADTEVTWHNGDTAAHTATSGTPSDGPDVYCDSCLVMAGGS